MTRERVRNAAEVAALAAYLGGLALVSWPALLAGAGVLVLAGLVVTDL